MVEPKWTGSDYGVMDDKGNWLGSVNSQEKNDLGQYKWNEGQKVYSYNYDGGTYFVERPEDIPTWVELDKSTGDIKVSAPDVVLNSDMYKNKMKPLLTKLSQAYKTQPDYKIPDPFSDTDETYSIEEIVQKVMDGINENQMALGSYYRGEDWFTSVFGEGAKSRYTPTLYYILGSNGVSGRDDAIISIPRSVVGNSRFNFFKNAESYVNDTMTVKDFKDLYYHTDFFRDEFGNNNPHELKKLVENNIVRLESMGIDNLSDEDLEEYMRLQAFYTYLNYSSPRGDIINDFLEEIWATGEGALRATADFTSAIVSVTDAVWNRIFGLEPGTKAYELYGNPLSTDITVAANVLTNVVSLAHGWGVVSYDDMLSTDHVSAELRKQYDERGEFYADTNRDAATWYMIGYTGTKVAENIAASQAVTSVALGAVARMAGIAGINAAQTFSAQAMGLSSIPSDWTSATEIMNTAITGVANPNMFQLISGLSKINPTQVANAALLTVKTAAETKNVMEFASSVIGLSKTLNSMKTLKRAATISDLIAQVVIDSALHDPVATKKLIEGAGTEEDRRQIWENMAWTASGYATGLILGKMISAFPSSTTGKAANEAATRKLWQFETWVSEKRDEIKTHLFGENFVDKIKNPGKRQVGLFKQAIQAAGEEIAKSAGDVSATLKGATAGVSTSEAIRHFTAVQSAIAQVEAGVSVKMNEYMSNAHPTINTSVTNLHGVTTELARMIEQAGYKTTPNTNTKIKGTKIDLSMGFPQEINNYTGTLIQKRILDNKIKPIPFTTAEGIETVKPRGILTPAQKTAYQRYTELIENYEKTIPENITKYIKETYIPALYGAGAAIRNYRISPKVSLDIKKEIQGYISTGMWGENGEEYAPMMRIPEATKQYEETVRNASKTVKTGFIKNRSSNPEAIQWGSEADFVNPTLAVQRYLTQTAMDEINQTLLRENLNTVGVKNVTLFDGTKTGAARTFDSLEPSLNNAVKDGLGGVKELFDSEAIAEKVFNDFLVKTAIEKAETQINKAQKDLSEITKEAPKINAMDKARALQTMSNSDIENVLNDAYEERLQSAKKNNGYINDYDKIATIEDALSDKSTWDKFILNSPIGVRRAIKRSVNSYSEFTGTRFVELNNTMRGRLNALVPGCDVYEWGMLGRGHTNGLTPEGLYEFSEGAPEVQAYIMSIDDVRKMVGLKPHADWENTPSMENVTRLNNTKGVAGVIPMYLDSSTNKNVPTTAMIFARWGRENDTRLAWSAYLSSLEARGIKDVPVAISKNAKFDKFTIDGFVREKLGDAPKNITEDMKLMFEEEGYVPMFHNQKSDLGTMEYNNEGKIAEGVDAYTRAGGIGDAYWIAPNSSYTDSYGDNKLISKIPTDSLLTDKELQSVKKELYNEKKKLIDNGVVKKISDKHKELYKKVDAEFNRGSDDALAVLEKYNNGEIEYDDALEQFAMSRMSNNLLSKPEKDMYGDFLDYQGIINDDDFIYKEGALDYIRDEDVKRYLELSKYVDDFGNVASYRSIAERTGKPTIDTTMEMKDNQSINGTAYFYYKGVDPKFDSKMNDLLKIQSEGTDKYVWDAKSVKKAAKEYEGMPLYEVLDNMYEGNIPDELVDAFDDYEKGLIGYKDLDAEMNDAMSRMRGKKLPESALALHMWNVYGKTNKLEDIKFDSKKLNKDIVVEYLKSQGETGRLIPASKEGKEAWEAIDPTNPTNVPVREAGFEPKKTANDILAEYGGDVDKYFKNMLEDFDEIGDIEDSINSLDNPYLPAPVDDPSLNYDAFRLVSQINPDAITDVNRAMLKANKDMVNRSDLIKKIAEEQRRAKLQLAAITRYNDAAKTLMMPTINARMKFLETLDGAIDKVVNAILKDENAVKVIDAIMVSSDGIDTDISRNYATMVYVKKNKKEIQQAASKVFKYDKFKVKLGKMPGVTIDKVENVLVKEIGKRIEDRLDEARGLFIANGGEVVDGDKILKEIHELMDEIEEAGHSANVVELRQNGESLLIETDPFVADLANYHVVDPTSTAEKVLTNPVFKGMNRMARFFQTVLNPASLRNQYIRDPANAFFGVGAVPVMDGIKHISSELATKYGEALAEQYKQMWPEDYKYLSEQAEKDGKDVIDYVINSITTYGSSTSPAMTQTAYYRNPFINGDVSSNFWGQLEKTKTSLGKAIKKMGEFVETPHQAREVYLRNLTYDKMLKDGLDAGMSLEDAMNQARFARDNATTNFRHQLYHFRALAGSVNYFGAGINGYTSFWRLFSIDPIGMSCRIFGGLVVPVIAATVMSLMSEENREKYMSLKEHEKNEQFVFVMNGQVYKIPIPQEFATFVNPIRHAVESLFGSNKHDFIELAMTDILNLGPIDFGDLMYLDRNEFAGDPTILDRMAQLGISLIDQTMPLVLKTIFSFVTGIDTFTGQPIDTSYYSFDDDGNRILVGGTQSEFSLALGSFTGWSPSVIAWTTKNLIGTVGRDILDAIVVGDPTRPITNTISAISLSADDYNRTASDWNKEMADLWREKEEKYLQEYNDYTDKINQENDPDKKQVLKNKRKDAIAPFLEKVKTAVNKLNNKYPGMYDSYRFAAVVSLLNFDSGVASGTDAAAKERDLQNFYENRDRARQWMQDLGISGGADDSILGHLERDKDGNIVVKINTPLEILSAQSLYYGASDIHVANIRTILESGTDSYKKQMQEVKDQISAIYNKGNLTQSDYDKIDDMKIEWDKKVMAALAPYIEKMTPEAAINNQAVLEYLRDYIYVPDAWKINNKGYHVTNKSLNYLGNAEDAFSESFIKFIFGVNDNKYDTSWNFSGRKTLGE